MRQISRTRASILGIECGGTRTVALAVDDENNLVQRVVAAAANAGLLTDRQLAVHFRGLARGLPRPAAIGIGMAGVREPADRRRIRAIVAHAWPNVPCWVGNDLETALEAASRPGKKQAGPRLVLISGTGSSCYGQDAKGRSAIVGGWGHLLGDQGSGYDIVMEAMRAVIRDYDYTGRWPPLGRRLLRALLLNEPNDLVAWIHQASKTEIAALAGEVFAAATERDKLARDIVTRAATCLVDTAVACAERLGRTGQPVEFVLVGGVLHNQPAFARRVGRELRLRVPSAKIRYLHREGAWGAVEKARRTLVATSRTEATFGADRGHKRALPAAASKTGATATDRKACPTPRQVSPSPTEQRNPRSMRLDRLSVGAAVELMLSEDARISPALFKRRVLIARSVRMAVRAFQRGGRLVYVGAGTSGRLGVLDASECPPTFGAPREQVQGIMAGGFQALWSSIEGAEDDDDAGAEAIRFRGVTRRDLVVGISVSGRTPFVWGALLAARGLGASTILLCFNPYLAFPRNARPDLVIAPYVGPEILTGSSRLKAGTATKMILNIITTLSMVRLGKVVSNLMVDVNPTNAKLRDRAVRIVQELTGADYAAAQTALGRSGWIIKRAWSLLGGRGGESRRA